MNDSPQQLYIFTSTACRWEVQSRKVGNVHPGASFENLRVEDFLRSAIAISQVMNFASTLGIGESILRSVEVTAIVSRSNPNLGIILLLAPLASIPSAPLRGLVSVRLQELTTRDAVKCYEAIRLANAGGMGDVSEQDVHSEPTVTLLEAMTLAADRDMVARQYANGYADVFDFGVPAFLDAFAKFGNVEAAIIDCQLRWLAEFPDSLIARKKGNAAAEDVQARVREVLRLGGLATVAGRRAGTELDRYLRSDGNKLNPGTTADLVTACLFVALRENKIQPSAPFRWDAPDWLAP